MGLDKAVPITAVQVSSPRSGLAGSFTDALEVSDGVNNEDCTAAKLRSSSGPTRGSGSPRGSPLDSGKVPGDSLSTGRFEANSIVAALSL